MELCAVESSCRVPDRLLGALSTAVVDELASNSLLYANTSQSSSSSTSPLASPSSTASYFEEIDSKELLREGANVTGDAGLKRGG